MKVRDKKNLLKKYSELKTQLIRTLENSDYEIDVDGDAIDQLQGQSLVNIQNRLSRNNLMKLRAIDEAIVIDSSNTGWTRPLFIERLTPKRPMKKIWKRCQIDRSGFSAGFDTSGGTAGISNT